MSEFSGSQNDYLGREFIGICEDVTHNSCVTEQGDKIAFVKSRLLPGSPATAFSDPLMTIAFLSHVFLGHFTKKLTRTWSKE